ADLRRRLPASGLGRTRLIIREPMAAADSSVAESQALRAGVLEQLYRQNETSLAARDARIRILEDEVVRLRAVQLPLDQLSREATALYPDLTSLGVGRIVGVAGGQPADTAIVIITGWRRPPDPHALVTLEHYFRARLNRDSVEVVIRPHRP
ncbi:MAG TPA: hypothetical protein VLD58_03430, partial [Gemmatimonadales bacterium]|nr:hypothetical protein [Gemmatimonadales bacterium]